MAGFAEIWDTWHDRPPAGLLPAAVPVAPPAEGRPHLGRISEEAVGEPPDVLFESVVVMLVAGIEGALLRPASQDADAPASGGAEAPS
ncbi:hypothetical protein [Nonomuraea sp. NPDC049158]|uniref:hypothetical protein n=1 Tax=Nonomuraea sp. NPDC049158 TaxID=3155649 RepID=UPI0033E9DBF1